MFYIKRYIRKLSQFWNFALKATREALTCDTTRAHGKTSCSCAQHSTVKSSGKKKERLHCWVTTRCSAHSIARANQTCLRPSLDDSAVWRKLCRQPIGRCETSRTVNNVAMAWAKLDLPAINVKIMSRNQWFLQFSFFSFCGADVVLVIDGIHYYSIIIYHLSSSIPIVQCVRVYLTAPLEWYANIKFCLRYVPLYSGAVLYIHLWNFFLRAYISDTAFPIYFHI